MKYTISLCLFLSLFVILGCQRGPRMVTIKGTVTVGGEPIDRGMISFEPVDKSGSSGGAKINKGEFEAKITPGEKIIRVRGSKSIGQVEADPVLTPGRMVDKLVDVTSDLQHWKPDTTKITVKNRGNQPFIIDLPPLNKSAR